MMYQSLLHAIGHTPLVRIPFDSPAHVYAKLEYLNPGGSIKDRAALYMIEEAERAGILKPGGTIIEASSGNQGISAAMIGAVKGYKVIITASTKVSAEKLATMQAYGAELRLYEPQMHLDHPESYRTKALELHRATPNSFFLNQYFNAWNPEAHYHMLGKELWEQTQGTITHFIAAAGSGGTVSGAGKYLKEHNKNIQVIAVDAATSYRSTQGNPKPYKIEGMGVDYDSPVLHNQFIDSFALVEDAQGLDMLKVLARQYGLLVGPPSGAVAHATQTVAKNLTKNDLVVMLLGDSGRAYLSKNYYAQTEPEIPVTTIHAVQPTIQVK